MPFSSRNLTSEPSLYLAGGSVKWRAGVIFFRTDMLALRDVRYRALRAVIFALVRRAVDREAAAKANGVAGGTESIAAAIDIRNNGIKLRRCHLASGKAVEYELIQLILICGKIFLYLIRLERGIRGSDSFVRVLCARLGLIGAGDAGTYSLP